ncbi:three-Cys-motif partner protein TcmP [Deinococcus sp. UYEF24]
MPTPDDFFNNSQRLASKIKTDLVVKYLKPWLDIMNRHHPGPLGYVDLFCGPGKFVNDVGAEFPSTPLRVLDLVAENPALTARLQLQFNDAKAAHVEQLKTAMSQHAAWRLIEDRVTLTSEAVTSSSLSRHLPPYPSLYFLDPFGYGGFSLADLNRIVQGHGNDLLFFFNYNRFNPELNHPLEKIRLQTESLLGSQSLSRLLEKLAATGAESRRQAIITDHLWTQLEMGGLPRHYVVPFEFKFGDRDRTSHYIVFVSKNKNARRIIKEVMAGLRTDRAGGSFEFNPHAVVGGLFDGHFLLGDELQRMFSGRTLTVGEIIAAHDLACLRAPYVEKDYKEALKQLRQQGHLSVIKPDHKPVPAHQMPDAAIVTFS